MNQTTLTKAVRNANQCLRAAAYLQLAGVAFALGSAAHVPSALAQGSEKQFAQLEEIVVTARRREESLGDVPIAVSVLDENFLREQNITELTDLGTHVPSLLVSDTGTSTNEPIVALRGQRPSELLLTLDPAVPLYFAEVVLTPTTGTNLALYDLANVQVLKGPQGTLFGRNSTGGAILFTPQTPEDEFGGYAEAKIGDYNLYHFEGAVDVPVNDALALRFAGRSIDRDGYQSNVAQNALRGDDRYWDENSYGLRVTAKFTPNDRLKNLTTVAYDENEMVPRVGVIQSFNAASSIGQLADLIHNGGLGRALNEVAPGLAGILGIPTEPLIDEAVARQKRRDWQHIETDLRGSEKVENWFAANNTEFELSDSLTIKNIFGYRDLDYGLFADTDGTALPIYGSRTSTTEPVTLSGPRNTTESTQYSDELQLLGNAFDDRLQWLVGGFWMRMKGSQATQVQLMGANLDWPAGPSLSPQLDVVWKLAQDGAYYGTPAGDVENEAMAIFGEGTYSLNEQWSLTLGARQTWDKREMTAQNFGFDFTALEYQCLMRDENDNRLPDDACSRKVDKDFDRLTWRASVNFTPREDMLLYGSVSTGYRSGGFNMRGSDNFTLQPFDEETVTTYELGNKTDWHLFESATMRTNLAIYFQQYDDIQKTVDGTNPATGSYESNVVNAAEAEIKGVEFDVTIAPTASLTMTLAWSWVNTEYKKWDREIEPGVFVDFTKSDFLYIPENSLTGSVRYTLPLDPSIGEVSLMGSVYWQDEMTTNDDPWRWHELGWSPEDLHEALATAEIDDYSVCNFRIDWQGVMGSGFDLGAFVNNAFDEEYIVGGASVPEILGIVLATYGPPRTYGMSLRYHF